MSSNYDPLVSIIIPVYNGSTFLNRAIDSAINQTYKNKEVLVINDGSTDENSTRNIALSYNDKIKYFEKANGGVSTARNLGLENAVGEYVAFIDADDFCENDCLEKLVLACNNKFELICAGYNLYSVNDNIITKKTNKVYEKENLLRKDIVANIWEMIMVGYFSQPWNKLYSLKIIRENSLTFNCEMDIGEDLLFNLQYVSHINKLKCISNAVYNYNITFCNLTRKIRENRVDIHMRIAEEYEQLLINNNLRINDAYTFAIKSIFGAFTDLFNTKAAYKGKKKYVKRCINLKYIQKIICSDVKLDSYIYKLLLYLIKNEHLFVILFISKLHHIIKYRKIRS